MQADFYSPACSMYLILKQIHITLVSISVALFQIRYWRTKYLKHQPNPIMRVLPHIIDTFLLSAGVLLIWLARFSIQLNNWLGIKLFAVVVYILLGFVAMKSAGWKQWLAYWLATLTVLYIMLIAHFKTPWPLP